MNHVKMALNLRAEHVPSLHLLILLLSAQKQHAEALQLVEAALEEYPDNLNLLYVKAHLELQSQGGEVGSLLLFVGYKGSYQMLQATLRGSIPYRHGSHENNM
jgi:hypothetical protein